MDIICVQLQLMSLYIKFINDPYSHGSYIAKRLHLHLYNDLPVTIVYLIARCTFTAFIHSTGLSIHCYILVTDFSATEKK